MLGGNENGSGDDSPDPFDFYEYPTSITQHRSLYRSNPGSLASTAFAISTIGTERSWLVRWRMR